MYELADKIKIIYFCDERKKFYTRFAKCDKDLEIQRKLLSVQFKMMKKSVSASGKGGLLLYKVPGPNSAKIAAEAASIPAYLFGIDYLYARRVDVNNFFDFRKSSYVKVKKTVV